MASFEISVNGERRFVGDYVQAITLVAEWVAHRRGDRVSVHVGVGDPGENEIQYLGADLKPGDEISIRVLAEDHLVIDNGFGPESCTFCGIDRYKIGSLVAGSQVAICDECLMSFHSAITQNTPLPFGASIEDHSDARCGFCLKGSPEILGLIVQNGAALCAECLRACLDLHQLPTGGYS